MRKSRVGHRPQVLCPFDLVNEGYLVFLSVGGNNKWIIIPQYRIIIRRNGWGKEGLRWVKIHPFCEVLTSVCCSGNFMLSNIRKTIRNKSCHQCFSYVWPYVFIISNITVKPLGWRTESQYKKPWLTRISLLLEWLLKSILVLRKHLESNQNGHFILNRTGKLCRHI